ncbi:MAG: hypothetical protein ACR2IV_23025 [Bryobacteraceae bacterium]
MFVLLSCLALPIALRSQSAGCQAMSTGPDASLNGFVPFNSSSLWNADVSTAAVDPNSENIINFIGATSALHPDFGSGEYAGSSMGIPYQVETITQPRVKILLGAYADESDPGPASVPRNALIEGYPNPGNGDRHVLVLDKNGCWLYELYDAHLNSNGTWNVASAALWDLLGNEQRPHTWTSADAAGLPIFPGLVRYDEVSSGSVHHAFRYTVPTTRQAFALPATHWASSVTDTNAPPMGMRLRLKASFDTSAFSALNQVILIALKKYGMILADNGSGIFLSGAPDSRWNNDDLGALKQLRASDFEVVSMGTIYTPGNVPVGNAPVIQSFKASPASVSAGSSVQLSWGVSGSEYNIIDPVLGAVRGNTAVVKPTKTTTYRLSTTNQYGRSVKYVKVIVQ